ncbi:MAG TPA: hypothetical protein VFO10_01665 [Oligoflexus sp.]|uniref:hypothetical protein n=1 Tax=Oligoflexus sp. TaxID=1971216 RepID=UPI002D7FEA2E|nr:hypothetical protein [Oligoflexus sp.]HET9235924.1 hypothetical protein [Oligoflexus sp.]
MSPLSKVQLKWIEAASDLQLTIEIDFDLVLKNILVLKAPVFLHDFGGEKGTLILESFEDISSLEKELTKAGFGFSVQKSHASDKYDREIFIEMLTEWGWTGNPDRIPVWYPEQF